MDPVYLDHAATTPVRPEVRDAMEPYLSERFGNPNSAHRWGREARAALERARARAAEVLGTEPSEIFFVGGGSESDNLAVLGRARAVRAGGERPVAATTLIEHKAVLESVRAVAADGGEALWIGVDASGSLDDKALARALETGVSVLSVMWVNNETGMILPVEAVARRACERGIVTHSDAVQAVGHVRVRLDEVPLDLLSVAGHKIYGPKGTGLLFVRRGVDLAPVTFGGGQERGLRPGTQDVAGAVGLAEALERAVVEQEAEGGRQARLRDRLAGLLKEGVPGVRVFAEEASRSPHVLSVGIPDVDGSALVAALDMEGVAVSGGSACDSGGSRGSHVLEALYGEAATGLAALRFSLGRTTSEEHVVRASHATARVVARARTP